MKVYDKKPKLELKVQYKCVKIYQIRTKSKPNQT